MTPRDESAYETFWRTRDVAQWTAALADDVVLASPLLRAPLVGRTVASDLFTVLAAQLEDVVITGHFRSATGDAFTWDATAHRRPLSGIDVFHYDPAGLIDRIDVAMRPLAGLAAFVAAVAAPLATRRKSRWRRAAAPLGLALLSVAAAVDATASALLVAK